MTNNPKYITILNKVTDAQLETLANGGSITKGSDTLTADEGAVYLTPDVIDSVPTANSTNAVQSGGVYSALAGKVDKTNTSNQVYGTDGNGNQTTWTVSQTENVGTIVRRDTGGVIYTGTPTNNRHATTKLYVDTAISGKEDASNKVTALSSSSTNDEYPSAKCVYDLIGDVESLLGGI